MSDTERVETRIETFLDEQTGKTMHRVVTITYQWVEGISRHHGDDTGYTGWSEWRRDEEIIEAPPA